MLSGASAARKQAYGSRSMIVRQNCLQPAADFTAAVRPTPRVPIAVKIGSRAQQMKQGTTITVLVAGQSDLGQVRMASKYFEGNWFITCFRLLMIAAVVRPLPPVGIDG